MKASRNSDANQTPELPGFRIFGAINVIGFDWFSRIFNALKIPGSFGVAPIFNALKIYETMGGPRQIKEGQAMQLTK